MTGRAAAAALAALGLLAGPGAATTWRVEPDGTGDAPTIAAALAAASIGDTVEVACGTYFESDLRMDDGILLTSETGLPDCVTIDAQRADAVLRCRGVDSTATIRGLTLTGGDGMFGGGIDFGSASSPLVEDCVIVDNIAAEGGGVFCVHSSPTLRRCRIEGNAATYWGGGLSCYDNASPTLEDCTIAANTAGDWGGGVWTFFFSEPTFTGCRIVGNVAGGEGGGFFFIESAPTIEGCTIAANSAAAGGGLGVEAATPTISESILWGNCAADGREVLVREPAALVSFSCADVDTSDGWLAGGGQVSLVDVISLDPDFCDATPCGSPAAGAAEWTLREDSPCLPAASPCGALLGARGAGCPAPSNADPSATLAPLALSGRPNPFRDRTTLGWELPRATAADVRVVDAAGRLVRVLGNDARLEAGAHRTEWDGRDDAGRPVAAGVYFVRITAGTHRAVARVVRVR